MTVLHRTRSQGVEAAKRILGRRGYAITRPRFHEENSLDVRALLAEPIERRQGRFVVLQVGANDGIANDPIHDAVVARGWELFAVEPMPAIFEKLQRNYGDDPRFHYIQCAVGPKDGTADLFYLEQPEAVDGDINLDQYTSFSRDVIEQHWRLVPDLKDRIRTTAVQVLTLSSLIDTYMVPPIDMLQIDTEGFDYEIIKMAFAEGITPPILAFEWENLSREDMWSCRSDLIAHGYRWIVNKGDVIASRAEIAISTQS